MYLEAELPEVHGHRYYINIQYHRYAGIAHHFGHLRDIRIDKYRAQQNVLSVWRSASVHSHSHPSQRWQQKLPLVADLLLRLNGVFLSPGHRFRRILAAVTFYRVSLHWQPAVPHSGESRSSQVFLQGN